MTVKIVSPDNLERYAQGADEKFAEASHTHSTATTTSAGFMSAEDKQNLDDLVQNGGSGGGIQEITTGSANGTISVDGTDVSVKGLGSAAYTASTDYATSGHTHATTLASDSGTASITLAHGSTYKLSAGGTDVIFTMPTDNNTTYSSKAAASGGTDVSLVTTGEKYTWNNKSNLTIGTTATTAAAGNHTHSYLPLSGGTLTGNLTFSGTAPQIYYTGSKSNYSLIRFIDNDSDTYGNGISIGGGGAVIIGGGESATTMQDTAIGTTGNKGGSETLALCNDGNVDIYTNCQDGASSAKKFTFTTGGVLQAPNSITVNGTAVSLNGHTHNYAGSNSAGGPANKLYGIYTGSGGQQGPSYFGKNTAGCLMSNVTINGDSNYKNWLYMDNYGGTDVGGTSAIGVSRMEARAFIMQSAAARSSWANTAELLSTANWSTYCAAKSHTHSYLSTSGGTVSGSLTVTGTLKGATIQSTSDIRKKSNIVAIDDVDLHSIKAYEYNLEDNKRRSTGLIAQEVEKILPTAVEADENGFLSLDYNAVVAVLVNKVNQLEARISELENK